MSIDDVTVAGVELADVFMDDLVKTPACYQLVLVNCY